MRPPQDIARPRRRRPAGAAAVLALAALLATSVAASALSAAARAPSQPGAQSPAALGAPEVVNPGAGRFVRVRVTILGIFSPRGIFNLVVRLYKLNGLERFKFDMPDALMTLDFKPGVAVERKAIRAVMVDAGYQPGPFKIDELPASVAATNERGWLKPPKVESKWALIRWLQLNF